jgi:hypothetical protein
MKTNTMCKNDFEWTKTAVSGEYLSRWEENNRSQTDIAYIQMFLNSRNLKLVGDDIGLLVVDYDSVSKEQVDLNRSALN